MNGNDSYMAANAIAHEAEKAGYEIQCTAAAYSRPSVLMKPKLFIEGNQWCALYGENFQNGIAGFGDSPAKAMEDFDNQWGKDLKHKVNRR